MYESEFKSIVNISVHWMIASSIVGTPSTRRNKNPLSWNKVIRNILINVDLMGMIILKLELECFNRIY
jgi:hypothetical protein